MNGQGGGSKRIENNCFERTRFMKGKVLARLRPDKFLIQKPQHAAASPASHWPMKALAT